jgi:hypothetical protein
MKLILLIEEELTTYKYGIKYNLEDVINIGKIYYPKLKVIDSRFYINYPKNKGSYSFNSFISLLLSDYIDYLLLNLKGKVDNLIKSNTTNSIYFEKNNTSYRISDHNKNNFNGKDIKYNLFTDLNELLSNIFI